MPLFKIININASTKIFVWEITESYQQLLEGVRLNEYSIARLSAMKSELHQRAFLSVRSLLQLAGYTDFDLYYDRFGKPHLKDDVHISISHSHHFSAIILSDRPVGVDLEMQREKILRIADKFAFREWSFLPDAPGQDLIRQLTVIWGVKEAIFKIRNEKGISFRDHIVVNPFSLEAGKAVAELCFEDCSMNFNIFFHEFQSTDANGMEQNYTLVYALE